MRLTIIQKGVLLIALPLLAQGVFVGTLMWFQGRYAAAQERAARGRNVLEVAPQIEGQVIALQSGARGYALTGDRSLVGLHDPATISRDADRLIALLADDPPRLDQARRVGDRARRAVKWEAELIRMCDDGRRPAATEKIKTGGGKQLVDEFRVEVGEFLAAEERHGLELDEDLDRLRRTLNGILIVGAAATIIGMIGLAVLFNRGINRRLARMSENVRRSASGVEPAEAVSGTDEIAAVDRAVHEMASKLQALNRDLEERVRARTADLDRLNRELAQKNQENELFVYSVSHDLRGPLVNLQGFSRELQKACDGLRALFADPRTPVEIREEARPILDQKVAKALGFIQSAVARLGGIIDALLRLSRAGRVEYRWERVEMNRLVGQLLSSVQGTIAEKRATVGASDLPAAWGDATALGQVFANLVSNALTYLGPTRPGSVEIGGTAEPDGSVTYFVKDNGLGIPVAYRDKVFQLFQRAHPEVGQGEGLGLAIVARVVDRHHGKVWVESVEGQGSTFYVRLPGPPPGPAGGTT